MPRRLTPGFAAKDTPLVRVAIVHDQHFVRRGIADCLRELGGYELVLAVATGGELLTACRKGAGVDLALVQLRTAGMDGCATLAVLREHWPTIGRLALCEEGGQDLSVRALAADAQALLPAGADAGALSAALADVQRGRFHMNPLVKALFQVKGAWVPRRRKAPACNLTPKQLETLCWKAHPARFTEPGIAVYLQVKPSTVHTHMKEVRRKLGVRSGDEAVRRALKLGLVAVQ